MKREAHILLMHRMPLRMSLRMPQSGFSLLEYMVAIVMGLLIIGVVLNIYLSSWTISRAKTDLSDLQEQGRDLLSQIGQQVRQAGAGVVNPYKAGSLYTFRNIPAATGTPGAYSAEKQRYAPDTLTVAYLAAPGINQDCLNQATPMPADGDYPTITSTYTLDTTTHTLSCTGSGNANGQPLSYNVEDFQVRYGLANTAGTTPNDVDSYARSVTDATAVRTVAICFVLLGKNQSTTTQAQTYNDCQGKPTTAPDNRLRMVFRETFALRNLLTQTR